MFDKIYNESSTEKKMQMLIWELEHLAFEKGDSEIGFMASQIKMKFWERENGTTFSEYIKKQHEEKGNR